MGSEVDPLQFIERLRRGILAVPVQVVGMVQADGESTDSLQLSKDCSTWISIPASMIEEISLLGAQKCKDHKHHVAGIRFKEPQTEEGAVYARLITEQLATPPTTPPTTRPTTRRGGGYARDNYGGCAPCLMEAYRICGNYDYYCVKDYLMSVCPECAG